VLAGGQSQRFGTDKLAAAVEGQPSVVRVVDRVAPLASRIEVSTSSRSRQRRLARLLPSTVRFLVDPPLRAGRGPGESIVSALRGGGRGPILFVPGDMPWVETDALARFVALAEASGAEAAVPFWGSGETENLVQWHRSVGTVRFLPEQDERPSRGRRASEILRAVPRTCFVPVRALSRRPRSFSHLTRPSDVDHPPLRGSWTGSSRSFVAGGFPKREYHRAHAALRAGRSLQAGLSFVRESLWYAQAGLDLFARQALDDAEGCDPPLATARSRARATVNPHPSRLGRS